MSFRAGIARQVLVTVAMSLGGCRATDTRAAPELPSPAAPAPPGAASAASGAISPEAVEFPYPHAVFFHELRSQRQSVRMAYMDVTPQKPNGRSVVLLHGKNFSGAYWKSTVDVLTSAGFRVIVPDQIGFGKSSKPERYQYSFAALATNTRALLGSLGVERSAVVGHSMGGMLAVRYALMFPDRTEQLVLVNPIGLEDYAASVPYRTIDDWYRQELELTPEKVRAYQKKAYYQDRWRPEYEPLVELQIGFLKHPEYARVAWASALTYDMIFTQPVVHELPRLRAETLLIIGLADRTALGKDLASPEVAAALGNFEKLGRSARAAIPNAQLVELPGIGHLPQVQAFDVYAKALLGFLAKRERG